MVIIVLCFGVSAFLLISVNYYFELYPLVDVDVLISCTTENSLTDFKKLP